MTAVSGGNISFQPAKGPGSYPLPCTSCNQRDRNCFNVPLKTSQVCWADVTEEPSK
jgi:hypothetical protein